MPDTIDPTAAPPPVSAEAYRFAMRFVPAAVTIIAARHGDERNGLTATATSGSRLPRMTRR